VINPLKIQRILVTGSSGFIGTHLVRTLVKHGYSVLGLDIIYPKTKIDNAQWLRCDILKADELKNVLYNYKPQAVVHLAARTDLGGKTTDEYAVNVEGVKNVVRAIAATPSIQRCIYTSSQLVCRIGYVPKQENDYKPSTIYGESKVLTEKIVRDNDGGGMTWCIVRPTTIWGPGMNPHYQRFFNMIQRGWYFHVGHRRLYKSYGYVGNTVFQFVKMLEAPAEIVHRRLFFIADYEPLSLRAWTNAIQKELKARPIPTVPVVFAKLLAAIGDGMNLLGYKRFQFNSFRLNNILTEYQIDLSATKAVCGELPYSVDDGIKATVAWFLGKTE
jgi:nucleoside-diphosphate-sugar epimerase